MATQHPRIGVTRDPELAAALAATRRLLEPGQVRSEAGHVRQLALLGASALVRQSAGGRAFEDREVVLTRPGVKRATRTLDDLEWLATVDVHVDVDRRASRALDEVRGD